MLGCVARRGRQTTHKPAPTDNESHTEGQPPQEGLAPRPLLDLVVVGRMPERAAERAVLTNAEGPCERGLGCFIWVGNLLC